MVTVEGAGVWIGLLMMKVGEVDRRTWVGFVV